MRRKLEWLDKEDLLKRIVSREFGRFLAYYANAPEIEEVAAEKKEKGKAAEGRKVHRRVGDHDAEPGYRVARPYWHRGVCTEALQLLIDYCLP